MTLDKWKQAIFRIGFLLEGRSDEEQPEHMLGCGVFYGELLVGFWVGLGRCQLWWKDVTAPRDGLPPWSTVDEFCGSFFFF